METKSAKLFPVVLIHGISCLILFFCSSFRHIVFQSTAWDLAIFDQAIYLISQGQEPISSIVNFHILGDHAALVFYPLGLLYWIYPSVYWLLFIQAFFLTAGVWPIYALTHHAGLKKSQCWTVAIVYLLYPVIFNINLFDFHTEVLAIPAILASVWAARTNRIVVFIAMILWILACKAVLALTVIVLGIWLLFLEKKPYSGSIAVACGSIWFLLTTQLIIPFYRGDGHSAIAERYGYLGQSISEILVNLFLRADLVFKHVVSLQSLEYFALLLLPVIWALPSRYITCMIPAIPTVGLNLLSEFAIQRDLIHQYSLPIVPFFIVTMIAVLQSKSSKLYANSFILAWATIGFIALAKPGYLWTKYLTSLNTWTATKEAIEYVKTDDGVLTTAHIAPHLSHRVLIDQTYEEMSIQMENLKRFKYVLLNAQHPGWNSTSEFVQSLSQTLSTSPDFDQIYEKDGVLLFVQI